MKTIEQLAIENGFEKHPVGGIIVRHSSGAWVSVEIKLEALCKSYLKEWLSEQDEIIVDSVFSAVIDYERVAVPMGTKLIALPKDIA